MNPTPAEILSRYTAKSIANYAKIRELAKSPVYKEDVKASTQYQKMIPDCDKPNPRCAGGRCEES